MSKPPTASRAMARLSGFLTQKLSPAKRITNPPPGVNRYLLPQEGTRELSIVRQHPAIMAPALASALGALLATVIATAVSGGDSTFILVLWLIFAFLLMRSWVVILRWTAQYIVIADETKWVETLGRFPLPIEVISFGLGATRRQIEKAFAECGVSGQLVVRNGRDGHVFVTDSGHWIVDAHLGRIPDAPRLAQSLGSIPGVVEHGLFIGLASIAMLAGSQGIRVVERR